MSEGEEGVSADIEAREEASEPLELVERALDDVAVRVDVAVVMDDLRAPV